MHADSQCESEKLNYDPVQLTCLAESRVQWSGCYHINLTLWEMHGGWGVNQSVILGKGRSTSSPGSTELFVLINLALTQTHSTT